MAAVESLEEFWNPGPESVIRSSDAGGAGFDLVWYAGLRDAVRSVVAAADGGAHASLIPDPVCDALKVPPGFAKGWRAVQMLENHDLLLVDHSPQDRKPRIPALADPSNPHSWFGRSRTRVATGLLLTAPGVPMLFMGQEFLEDKFWSDSPERSDYRI
ncbi:hypothetical protein [Rhizobium leguminosarum]|uniref:hypothetical protein n=1 Tax=Rhizobium leguminosarum TaxID=384 RepID=UPI001C9594FF|nr:hypothetical protein [Rhizobium leguminosarum]MBY5645536.1 hypothetical protein [Rhizobium leguminosarum]